MLSEERYGAILDLLYAKGNVNLQELVQKLNTSESTIRRDLQSLENAGRLVRIHGGAVLKSETSPDREDKVSERRTQHTQEKKRIGQRAAQLIEPGDFVYIDAGTTTEAMLGWIDQSDATYVTNAISHAKILSDRGFTVYIPGGQFRNLTEAIVGEDAIEYLSKFNFTKGFFGTNAVSSDGTLSTPNMSEAATKRTAMQRCEQKFILTDKSKFWRKNAVNFGSVEGNTVITDEPFDPKRYPNAKFILV